MVVAEPEWPTNIIPGSLQIKVSLTPPSLSLGGGVLAFVYFQLINLV